QVKSTTVTGGPYTTGGGPYTSASAAVAVRSAATTAIRPTLAKISFFIRQSPELTPTAHPSNRCGRRTSLAETVASDCGESRAGGTFLTERPPIPRPESAAIDLK